MTFWKTGKPSTKWDLQPTLPKITQVVGSLFSTKFEGSLWSPRSRERSSIGMLLLLLLSHFSRVRLQQPHGLQTTRLLHPWDFLGKSTGVGCHCLLCLSLYVLSKPSQVLSHRCRLNTAVCSPSSWLSVCKEPGKQLFVNVSCLSLEEAYDC